MLPNWDIVQAACVDEFAKIAGIDLSGISHENVMALSQPAPPMETTGLSKAMAVLARYDQMQKVAFVDQISNPYQPELQRATGRKKKKSSDGPTVGGAVAHTVGGAGAGRIAADFAAGPKAMGQALRGKQWKGMALGAAGGAVSYAAKKMKSKEAMMMGGFSPANSLKISSQVAKRTVKNRGIRSATPHAVTRKALGGF